MFKKNKLALLIQSTLWIPLFIHSAANGLVIEEDFRNSTTVNNWLFPKIGGFWKYNPAIEVAQRANFACLTAGDGNNTGGVSTAGKPPKCTDISDTVGKGALRLTPAKNYQSGGIVSNFTFPTNDGVDISFTTYTYGGNGADGMSFALIDGDEPATLGCLGGA